MRLPAYTSDLHERRSAAYLGLALGVTFTTCFLTGLYSHLLQHEPSWLDIPSRPAGLYRITQSLHVLTGFASIPLLLAKLWVVHPELTAWPPFRSAAQALERVALVPLVGGATFLLFSGTANVAGWYPYPFFFTAGHFWAAWITIGGLVVHVGAKLVVTRDALRRRPTDPTAVRATSKERRAFLGGVAATSGTILLATAGSTFSPLGSVSALAQRKPGVGPQGVPVNKSASEAGLADLRDLRRPFIVVDGAVSRPLRLTLDDLRAMPQREAHLPIACVEGWSQAARWRGVPVRDLLALAGAVGDAEVRVESHQERGLYRASELNRYQAGDPDTLLALELNGEELHLDHGWPVRLIGPNRPGVLQTKWVSRLMVR